MTRESIEQKAARYIAERRLLVVERVGDNVFATCRGSDQVYELGFDPARGDWWCTCPAPRGCAHLAALHMIVVRPTGQRGRSGR